MTLKLVLLSGGSGKRLWPLSNNSRSKQFLKVLENEQGQLESMVQRFWGQLEAAGLSEAAVVATSKAQLDMIHSHLGTDVPLLVESERRDTFPAIALAAAYLQSQGGLDPDEIVSVLPVDPYVDAAFFEKVRELEQAVRTTGADLALIGVKPTYPSEKYGYIIPQAVQETSGAIQVARFQEKPSETAASQLIEEGALWNCGVFAFRLGYLLDHLVGLGLPTDYEALAAAYKQLPKISFDYQVVEKAQHIVVLPYEGSWKDLGTWNTLTDEIKEPVIGKGVISDDCVNTHLINELDIPVAVLGLSDVVVAASPDGILITDKTASPRVKDLVADWTQRPMFEERRWGWYRVLDHTKFENGEEVLTKRIGVLAGKNLSYQLHHKRSEVWTIIKGEGEFVLNDVIYHVKAGDVLQIPTQAKHGIKAVTDLEFIEVQAGTELVEEDIVRLFMTWEEVEAHCQHDGFALREVSAARA